MNNKQLQAENEEWEQEMERMHQAALAHTVCIKTNVAYVDPDSEFIMIPLAYAHASLLGKNFEGNLPTMTDLKAVDRKSFRQCSYLVDVLAIADKLPPGTALTDKRIKSRKSITETKCLIACTDAKESVSGQPA